MAVSLLATAALLAGGDAGSKRPPDFVLSEAEQKSAQMTDVLSDAALAESRGLSEPIMPILPSKRRPAPCRMTSISGVALCHERVRYFSGWKERDVRYVAGADGGWLLFRGTYETVGGRYRLASDAKGEHLSLCWERDALTCETVLGPRIDQYGGNDRYVVIARRDLPDETPRFYYVEAAKDGPGTVHGPLTAGAFAREKLTLALPEFDGIIVSR
ncbi:MAG: hypothetical protein QM608_12310 [Caulobacter sp.]